MDNKLLTCRKIQHMKTLKNKSFIFSFQSEEQRPRIFSCPTWIVILRPFLEIHFIDAFKTIMDWRLEMCWPYKDWYSLGVLFNLVFITFYFGMLWLFFMITFKRILQVLKTWKVDHLACLMSWKTCSCCQSNHAFWCSLHRIQNMKMLVLL